MYLTLEAVSPYQSHLADFLNQELKGPLTDEKLGGFCIGTCATRSTARPSLGPISWLVAPRLSQNEGCRVEEQIRFDMSENEHDKYSTS